MNTRVQLVCAYLGYPFIGLFLIGFWFIAGMVPPPDPAAGPEVVAQMFQDNAIWIRIGMLVATAGAVLTLPWQAVVAVQMQRIEGRYSPLTITFIMAGALFCLVPTSPHCAPNSPNCAVPACDPRDRVVMVVRTAVSARS